MMEKEVLIEKIKEIIKGKEFLLREDNHEIWENIYQSTSRATIRYKQNFIDYQNCYFKEYYESVSGFYEDCSFIVTRGKIPIGIVPFYIGYKDSKYFMGSNGEVGIYSPLIKEGYGSIETHRSIYDTIIRMYDEIAKLLGLSGWKSIFQAIGNVEGMEWQKKIMEYSASLDYMKYNVFCDLSLSEDEILKSIRRTNKYSIKKGIDLFNVEIVDHSSPDIEEKFEQLRQYHIKIAGRETRSKNTWNIQLDGVKNHNDFLVFIYDKETNELVGGALFNVSKYLGLYAVAAYDRSRYDQPIGHVVQWEAIKYMKNMGLKWYEIGERVYKTDRNYEEKLYNISHYKEGFSTNMFLYLYNNVPELEEEVK